MITRMIFCYHWGKGKVEPLTKFSKRWGLGCGGGGGGGGGVDRISILMGVAVFM